MKPTILLCAVLALSAVACVIEEVETSDTTPRFVVTRTPDQVVWITRRAQQTKIEGVVIEQLAVRSPAGVFGDRLQTQAVAAAREGFVQAMERIVGPAYPLVQAPAPGVLVVRAELTDRIDEFVLRPFVDELGAAPDGSLPKVALVVRFYDGGDGELLAALASVREAPLLGPMLVDGGTPEEMSKAFGTLATRLKLALDRAWEWNPGS